MTIVAAAGAISAVGSLIKSSAAGPNQDAAAQTLPDALGGNLAAVQAFVSRSGIQTVSSAQPWQAGLAQIRSAHPDWIDLARDAAAAGHFPASWWQLQPQQVFASTQSQSWTVAQQTKAAASPDSLPGATPGGSSQTNAQALMKAATGATASKWVVFGVAAVAVGFVGWMFLKRKRG